MITTEKEAQQKRCARDLSDRCITTQCMAWRWCEAPLDCRPRSLYSKRTGQKVTAAVGDDADWRLDDPSQPEPERKGYCGIAGVPLGQH